MPFYIGGGIGPLRYYHRLGGRRPARRRPPRPARHYTPAQARRRLIAGAVILAVSLAVFALALASL